MKIVKNQFELKKPLAERQLSQKEITDISTILKVELERHGGIGLSANQLGIDARMCIINVIDPLILVNPVIKSVSEERIVYAEQCLSIDRSMRKPVKTVRFRNIVVETDNLGTIEFGPKVDQPLGKGDDFWKDRELLESVCAQHEIDHLNGILITSPLRKYSITVQAPKKIGRNEFVMIQLLDGTTEIMKHKKSIPFLAIGCKLI